MAAPLIFHIRVFISDSLHFLFMFYLKNIHGLRFSEQEISSQSIFKHIFRNQSREQKLMSLDARLV